MLNGAYMSSPGRRPQGVLAFPLTAVREISLTNAAPSDLDGSTGLGRPLLTREMHLRPELGGAGGDTNAHVAGIEGTGSSMPCTAFRGAVGDDMVMGSVRGDVASAGGRKLNAGPSRPFASVSVNFAACNFSGESTVKRSPLLPAVKLAGEPFVASERSDSRLGVHFGVEHGA
jgi:hypothetical protein